MDTLTQPPEQGNTHDDPTQLWDTATDWMEKLGPWVLFTDQHGVEWARVPVKQHFEMHRLKSKAFRNWLFRRSLRAGEHLSQSEIRHPACGRRPSSRFPNHHGKRDMVERVAAVLGWHDGTVIRIPSRKNVSAN